MEEMQFLIECDDTSLCVVYQRSILMDKKLKKLKAGDKISFLWPEDSASAKIFKGKIIELSVNESDLLDMMDEMQKESIESKRSKNKGFKKIKLDCNDKGVSKIEFTKTETRLKNRVTSLVDTRILKTMEAQVLRTRDVSKTEAIPTTSTSGSEPNLLKINQDSSEKENMKIEWIKDEINNLFSNADSCMASLITSQENLQVIYKKLQNFKNILTDPTFQSVKGDFDKLLLKNIDNTSFESKNIDNESRGLKSSGFEKKLFDSKRRRSYNMPLLNEPIDADIADDNASNKGTSTVTEKRPTESRRRSYNMPCFDDQIYEKIDIEQDECESFPQSAPSPPRIPLVSHLNRKRSIVLSDDEDNIKLDLFSQPSTSSGDRSIYIIDDDVDEDSKSRSMIEPKIEPKEELMIEEFESNVCDKENTEKGRSTNSNLPSNLDERDKNGLWTLQYKEADAANHIIELLPTSKIFVNSFKLQTVKDTCMKQTILARALLDIVFTEKAISTCSLKGRKASGKGASDDIRPGLYSDGVDAIMSYTRKYAKKQNWAPCDDQTILNSMRMKILQARENKTLNMVK